MTRALDRESGGRPNLCPCLHRQHHNLQFLVPPATVGERDACLAPQNEKMAASSINGVVAPTPVPEGGPNQKPGS